MPSMWSTRWRAAAPRISRSRKGAVQAGNLQRTEQRFVAPKRFNLWPQARRHTQWPGGGKPGDAVFDAFYATQFPSLESYPKQQEINRDALIALLEQIGPAVLLVHSQSGAFAWPVADARPKLVKAIVAIEPNGPPVYETDFKGAPDWFVDVGMRKTSGLGMVPLAYDPPLKPGEQLSFVRQEQARRARSGARLASGGARAQAAEACQGADPDPGRGGVLSRRLRSRDSGLSRAGRGAERIRPPARHRHPRQRPHDDAGKEQ